MNDTELVLKPAVPALRLQFSTPQGPIPLTLLAALQGPPGPPGKDGNGSGPSEVKWESSNW